MMRFVLLVVFLMGLSGGALSLTAADVVNDAEAQFNLGAMFQDGQGVPQNDKVALKWYRLAAEQGHAKAQFNLGFMYSAGQGVPQDNKTAVKWYRLAAKQGDASAQYNLGV
ncbi:MAG: sel1 repeat family protein, partial [Rhodospirillaceae bacterium]|nr:sel1 repeat family protein [Rhodospirillaceae bacterium]